jgi:long-chain acyl-CoA synthetase
MATETTTDAPDSGADQRVRTVARVWRDAVAAGRTTPAYLAETESGWSEVSWEEAGRRVEDIAHGLLALGLRKGDILALLGTTRLEWVLVDLAASSIGVVVVPIYPNSSAKDCAYILGHSEATAIVVEDFARERIEGVRSDAPRLEHLLTFADLDDLAAKGREHAAANPGAVEAAAAAIDPDDLLLIVYTSGTTGPPKGCMLLHRNYVAVIDALDRIEEFQTPGDVYLLFLPLAHTFAQLVLYAGASVGFTLALFPDMQRIPEAIDAVRPTVLPSVPRVYEKVYAGVNAQFAAATGVKRKLVDWSLGVGREVSRARQEGRPVPALLAAKHRIADKLVFSKVKARLGGRLRFAISGAAPLAREVLEFFHALDILVLEGYGLTESASGGSVNRPSRFRFGTVGPPEPGIDIRIADDGEILIRGANVFAGYFKDEQATRAALTGDGWLRTGDVGTLDEDGFLSITDRKKDIIITAGGKNVAPQNLEGELKRAPFVSQAIVIGDRRPYLVALVAPDEQALQSWATESGRSDAVSDLAGSDEVRTRIQETVDRINADRASYEQIKTFAVLPRDLSGEHDELTPTLKLKRRVVEKNFSAEIDALYTGGDASRESDE